MKFLRRATVMIFASVLAACAAGPPEAGYLQRSGEAVVLIRLISETDVNAGRNSAHFAIADFETGGETTKEILAHRLDLETAQAGWHYLLLKPGSYYVAIQPARYTDAFTFIGRWKTASRWRLEVPEGAKTVYAGTLQMRGPKIKRLFEIWLHSVDPAASNVVNEEKIAASILAKHMPRAGPPRTSMIAWHTGPVIIRSPTGANR